MTPRWVGDATLTVVRAALDVRSLLAERSANLATGNHRGGQCP